MSGRGEPAGCHGDALKGGLCARLSCEASARPPPRIRPVPLGPARPVRASTQRAEGALRAGALSLRGLGSVGCLWCGVGTGAGELFGVQGCSWC